jgi:hypothetical protein
VKGRYIGFDVVVKSMLDKIEADSETYKKNNTYFEKEHRKAIAKEIFLLKEALSKHVENLLK